MSKKGIEFERSSGNVYQDLGLADARELQVRGEIGMRVVRLLQERNLKQREAAAILGISQSEVSHLVNGHFSRFTTDKLFDFLRRMDQKVTIGIAAHREGEPYYEVR